MAPLAPSGSNSSDYFDSDDSSFLEALNNAVLPGDLHHVDSAKSEEDDKSSHQSHKRPHTDIEDDTSSFQQFSSQDDVYGASHFGDFGEYMRRKRAKLQIQNTGIAEDETLQKEAQIFSELSIYINGWTIPSIQDLRQLIVRHGGVFQPYLDKKSIVTHIITCSLTPAKMQEFKHMRVVRPEWLMDSAKKGVLLPWTDYIFRPSDRSENTQGIKSTQRGLLDNGFASKTRPPIPTFTMDAPISVSPRKKSPSKSRGKNVSNLGSAVAGTTSKQPVTANFIKEIESNSAGEASIIPAAVTVVPSKPSSKTAQLSTKKDAPTTHSSIAESSSKSLSKANPIYTTDPKSNEEASHVPAYAAHISNPHAQRVMNNAQWRNAHTSIAPDFIEGFYKNSRLHHLSTWKAELKELLREAQERAEGGIGELEDGQLVTGKATAEDDGGLSMRGAEFVLRSPTKGLPGKKVGEDKSNLFVGPGTNRDKGKGKAVEADRVIMHCDFDCFFVSAGLVNRPQLRGKAVVVCHSQDAQGGNASTSEIASASYEARAFGIKNGMSLQQARKLCPSIVTIPYEFELYKQFSLKFYTVLMIHADDLQAVSVDEALIDVTSAVNRLRDRAPPTTSVVRPYDPAKELAEMIRTQVRKSTDCEVSIGISHNILLARLATRRAKPASSYHLIYAEVDTFLAPLDISDLHGFGWSAKQKAIDKFGTSTLGELVQKSKSTLCEVLGKTTGETLYNAIRGVDEKKLESDKKRKSVSCDINYGIRFENSEQVETFIYQMAREVTRRLNEIQVLGRSITLKVMKRDPTAPVEPPKFMGHGACDVFNKQMALAGPNGRATNDDKVIGEHAWRLLKSFGFDSKELRGLGIQIQKLEPASGVASAEPGQARLPFQKVIRDEGSSKGGNYIQESALPISGPAEPAKANTSAHSKADGAANFNSNDLKPIVDLPAFSQIDRSVFEALPEDVRKELEDEYKRRSASPFPQPVAAFPRPSPRQAGGGPSKKSFFPPRARPGAPAKQMFPYPRKTFNRYSTSPNANVKRIAQQLAPRNRWSMSPRRNNPFRKLPGLASWKVAESELRKLDIDPEVFAILPRNIQREQITAARMLKTMGKIPEKSDKRVELRPRELSPGVLFIQPPPKARHIQPPTLKQQGKSKGEKLYFTETDDIQRVIEQWVTKFRAFPPNERDVEFFAKWLTKSVDRSEATDEGLIRAVAVVKWWLMLLKRYWPKYEWGYDEHDPEEEKDGKVGEAWWIAFRDVKARMDEVAKKRFGGKLSLR